MGIEIFVIRKRNNSLWNDEYIRFFRQSTRRLFFPIDQFYSKLKGNIISDEEYQSVKKLYKILVNLGEFNKLGNSQDTIT